MSAVYHPLAPIHTQAAARSRPHLCELRFTRHPGNTGVDFPAGPPFWPFYRGKKVAMRRFPVLVALFALLVPLLLAPAARAEEATPTATFPAALGLPELAITI